MFHLSQSQLNLLETCPRKFQHIYLDQLGTFVTPEQQERLSLGNRFHLLMQQRELGLPIQELAATDAVLQPRIEAFMAANPDLFQPDAATSRQSEHRRTLEFQGFLLTVIYDLVILDDRQAQILDWKTYPRPQTSRWLAQNWQTRLYPFVLAETSDYSVEQISMTYWFIQASSDQEFNPQSLTFPYSSALHQQTRQDLTHWLTHLADWLQRYETGEDFPLVPAVQGHCQACAFAIRCQREQEAEEPPFLLIPDLSAIEEVAL